MRDVVLLIGEPVQVLRQDLEAACLVARQGAELDVLADRSTHAGIAAGERIALEIRRSRLVVTAQPDQREQRETEDPVRLLRAHPLTADDRSPELERALVVPELGP